MHNSQNHNNLLKLHFHCSTHLELLSSHIFESQCLVREFAAKHYVASGVDEEEAKELAKSCVSQRDIQVRMNNLITLLAMYFATNCHVVTCRESSPCMNGC